jgi:outer membrane protein assembly factor BamB
MREVKHQPEQQNPVVEVPGTQARTNKPAQHGTTSIGSPRLPRAYAIAITGGIVLLVFVIIFAGILSTNHQPSQVGSKPSSSSPTGSPAGANKTGLLPNPTTTPIQARTFSGHNMTFTKANGVMYVGTTDNAVYALRMSDGTVIWHQKIDGSVDIQPFTLNGVVYVDSFVGQDGPEYIYALRQSDGSVLWRYTSNGNIYASPSTEGNDMIYIAAPEGISPLQASSGSVLWHFVTRNAGDSPPVVVNGIVYATSSLNGGSGVLDALRASDGRLLWEYQAGTYISLSLVSNGIAYINSGNVTLAALRASDGHRLWQRAIDATFIQPLQLVGGVLYTAGTKVTEPPAALSANPLQGVTAIGSLFWNMFQTSPAKTTIPEKLGQSAFYAIRASDGTVLWSYPMGSGTNNWASWFTAEHGVVYASTITATNGTSNSGDIYALQSSDGALIWHDVVTQGSPFDALLVNGVIYFGTDVGSGNSALYALRASDGSMLWNYPVAGISVTALMLDGTTLYAGAANGMVYALQANSGAIRWHYQTDVGF